MGLVLVRSGIVVQYSEMQVKRPEMRERSTQWRQHEILNRERRGVFGKSSKTSLDLPFFRCLIMIFSKKRDSVEDIMRFLPG